MTPREIIRHLAEAVAPDAVVSIPAKWLLELTGDGASMDSSDPMKDLSVTELAEHYGRSEQTIRAWLKAGVFPQAYRTPAGWRVPRGALRSVRATRAAAPSMENPESAPSAGRPDLRLERRR